MTNPCFTTPTVRIRLKPRFVTSGSAMLLGLAAFAALLVPCRGLTLYDFGNPTAEEQLYLELINRARADPPAEGLRLAATTDPDVLTGCRYFGVDLTMLQSEFSVLTALPPLAPNASLTAAARGHSAWMLAHGIQLHNETHPVNDPFSRMAAAGFLIAHAAENIYATAKSVWFGHAGFQVDWGPGGTGGMLPGRGHRSNVHNVDYREIGVGVCFGSYGAAGPQIVTQDFGTSQADPTLATGVAYYDLNSNNLYDIGEGITGLTVNVSGADVMQYCVTAIGGGWVVPVPASATTRTVTFSGLNVNQSASLAIPASTNAKADLKLMYAPPAITSSASAEAGHSHTLTFTPVGGASAYKWNRWTTAAAATENCENISNITASVTGTYSVLNTSVKQQGSASFHLENSTGASQSLQLSPLYYGRSSPSLTFQSRIRYATSSEQFKVQIQEEGGMVWKDVFSQTGSGAAGESVFNRRTADLSAVAGKAFRVRFLLSYETGGGYYPTSGDLVGWFMDAITFSGVSTLCNNVCETLVGTSGGFTPEEGTCLMSVAPVISGREFPASYQNLTVSGSGLLAPAIVTQPVPVTILSGSTATFTVIASGTTPAFQWYVGRSGVINSPVSGATRNSFATPALTSTASYWVRASNAAGAADSNTVTAVIAANTQAEISLGSLTATYNGTAKAAKATTKPAKLAVNITYNGSATAPVNAGSYGVVATINDATYQGSATGTLVISKAVAKAKLGNLAASYNGSAKSATAVTTPAGLTVDFTYGGLATPPTNAGSYAVVGTINDTNYQGKASGTLVISKVAATVIPGSLAAAYDGTAKAATAVTTPPGLAVSFTYKGSVTAPVNVGSYAVVGTINDTNYQGKASATLVISKATATVILGNLSATYDGTAKPVTATTTPAGLPVKFTYNRSATVPKNAGTYTVVATINHANYQGGATATLVISKATATVVLGNLTATYSGTAKSATATTTPAKLALKFTYDGLAAAPKNIGSYAVVATINNPNYQGSATGNLVISAPSAKTVASADALSPAVTYTNQQAAAGGTSPSYATWAANLEISNGLPAGAISNHTDTDFDCDGRSNLMEYAFGSSAVVANDPAPRMPVAQTTASHFVLQYQRDTALTDLIFTAQACRDLTSWKAPGELAAPSGFTDVLISTSGTVQTRQASVPRASGACYMRVRITRP